MIKLQVIGNLGRDCTVNNVNGRTVINFSVAHTERFRDSTTGEMKPRTTWVECAYWSDRTGVAPYLKKGTQVYVEGTPDVRTYPKNDGTTGVSLSLRVQSVQLLGSRGESGGNAEGGYNSGGYSSSSSSSANVQPSEISEPVDDLPF